MFEVRRLHSSSLLTTALSLPVSIKSQWQGENRDENAVMSASLLPLAPSSEWSVWLKELADLQFQAQRAGDIMTEQVLSVWKEQLSLLLEKETLKKQAAVSKIQTTPKGSVAEAEKNQDKVPSDNINGLRR